MNTNKIKTDGFSNPQTERFYKSWTEEQQEKNFAQEKLCGHCSHCFFLLADLMWILCLNPDSAYYYESVDATFSCLRHEPLPEDDSSVADREQPQSGPTGP